MLATQIIGYLGQDAQSKSTSTGSQYLHFSVAVNRKSNGQDFTQWFQCYTFQMKLLPYLLKGTKVFVDGDLKLNIYKALHGGYEVGASLNAKRIQLLGNSQENPQVVKEPYTKEKQVNSPENQQTETVSDEDSDDLPF